VTIGSREALAALLRIVPPELVCTLATKESAKAAWDAFKRLRLLRVSA
jgi:hypothetical protein